MSATRPFGLPPVWIRRAVLAPALVVLIVLGVTALPVALLVAAALSPLLPGRWRPLRLAWFIVVYGFVEAVALVTLFALWVATGFGRHIRSEWSQRAHYRLIRWMLTVLDWEARRVLGVRIHVDGTERAEVDGRPLVVMARHAGPGDSYLVVQTLLSRFHRDPRIVLKDTLQWDPAIDTALNRLPNRFIAANPGTTGDEVIARIAELSTHLDADDALVIFPEGGNFTVRRRERAIERLRHRGHHEHADLAERMRHLMAPRPGGVQAAVVAAPDAGVLFMAHTGLEHLSSVADLWRGLPMDTQIHLRLWHVPAADVPREPEAFTDWLYEWWTCMDEWIGGHRGGPGESASDPVPPEQAAADPA